MGKNVRVFGYKNGLRGRSPYLFAPDRFIDLERHLQIVWHNNKGKIVESLKPNFPNYVKKDRYLCWVEGRILALHFDSPELSRQP